MPVNTDAYIYVGHFSPDDSPVHELSSGRGAWIQVVDGSMSVGGVALQTGDGAGFTAPRELAFTVDSPAEVLLIDVRMDADRVWE